METVSGYIKREKEGLHLNFRVQYRAPGDFALRVLDGVDGTPLFFTAGRRTLTYDPVIPAAIYSKDAMVFYRFEAGDESVVHEFRTNLDEPDRAGEIVLDLRSLFDIPAVDCEVAEIGDRTYRLSRKLDNGNSFVAHVNPSRPCPYTRVEVIAPDSQTPVLCLEKIIVDEAPGDDQFRFPTVERIAAILTVLDTSTPSAKQFDSFSMISRASWARTALRSPKRRAEFDSTYPAAIDWAQVTENDKKCSKAMADLLCPLASKGPAVGSKAPARR